MSTSYTLRQAAQALRQAGRPTSISTLRRLCAEGAFPGARLVPQYEADPKGAWRIPQEDLAQTLHLPQEDLAAQEEGIIDAEVVVREGPEVGKLKAVDLGQELLSLLKEQVLPGLREAGGTEVYGKLLAKTEEENLRLREEVVLLRAELEHEKRRPLTAQEMWWGRRG